MLPIQEKRRAGVFGYMAAQGDNTSTFHVRLPATPVSVGIFRAQLRAWLETTSVNPGEIFDIVLACSECLTLVVEERPRQVALTVDVHAAIEAEELAVTTRDYGLWHDSHAREQEEPLSLSLMRALMDSVDLRRHCDGQTITLRRRLTPRACEHRALLI
jgi:anti-sigma regulatory factor (Ser/Thr protein kinase)